MRGNAADRAAVPPREEKLRLAMFEPRILARREEAVNLALQRRHPRRIAAIEAIGELDDFAQIGLVLDRVERDRAVRLSARGWFPDKPSLYLSRRIRASTDRKSVVSGKRV